MRFIGVSLDRHTHFSDGRRAEWRRFQLNKGQCDYSGNSEAINITLYPQAVAENVQTFAPHRRMFPPRARGEHQTNQHRDMYPARRASYNFINSTGSGYMKRLACIVMGCVVAGALSVSANAADLALKAAPAPAPVWSWTGFYVGANVGAGWGTTETSLTSISAGALGAAAFNIPLAQNSRSGFLGGGQAGYNYQSGWAVFGIQGDIAGLDVNGTTPCLEVISCTSKSDWLATVTGRIGGVLADRALIYVKGGAAWMHDNQTATVSSALGGIGGGLLGTGTLSASSTAQGWLLGFGTEYAFSNNWSAFVEYDYIDFQGANVAFPVTGVPGAFVNADVANKLSIAKVGVNYKFAAGGY
jgi:outer membrane immunogenic protein